MRVSQKYLVLASLYIVQSVPLSFLKTGFQSFLRDQNYQYDDISRVIGLLMLPWVVKFLWAPLMDKWCGNRLPKIKYSILLFQIIGSTLLGFAAMADFPSDMTVIIGSFFMFSLVAATQDIVVDALAVLTLPKKEHGWGNTLQIGGYYLGEVLGGALILIIFDRFGWNYAMVAFMLFFLLPFLPVLIYKPAEKTEIPKPAKAGFDNVLSFFKQQGMVFWLLVLAVYMGNQVLARTLLPSMLIDMAFSKTEIGSIISIWGNLASVIGAILGGVLINKLGRKNSLVWFGVLKVIALLGFFLVKEGATNATIYSVIISNDFTSGLATVTIYTIMMDKCRLSSPGTDFTIQQSVTQFAVLFFVVISGILVKTQQNNFSLLFSVAFGIGVIGVLMAAFGIKNQNLDNGLKTS